MLSLEVPLYRVRNGLRVSFADGREAAFPPRAEATPNARSLALGYRLQRALDEGEASSHRELAALMGVSHPRVSMLIGLTFLAPRLQEAVLAGGPESSRLSFYRLLKVARIVSWAEQRDAWDATVVG
jgi:alkylated DNA nucleotide flippase Atl1